MNAAAELVKSGPPGGIVLAPPGRVADNVFRGLTWVMAMFVMVLLLLVGWVLWHGAQLSLAKFGWHFFVHSNWDPGHGDYGALPFIFGTFVSSLIALLIALPLSLATAVYLTELAPGWLRQPSISMIEMLAAIPSVVFGLWAILVLVPWMQSGFYPALQKLLGIVPWFQGRIYGQCILSAGVILAIMIVPIITSISREVFRAVPDTQREAAFALGATRWEVTRLAVLRYSTRGIFGAAMLGLGRALGETMAVMMVIGNREEIPKSLFAPAATLASGIANEFAEATQGLYLSALFELGLMLVLVTVATNVVAHLLIGAIGGQRSSGA